jgi:hypothetical protein
MNLVSGNGAISRCRSRIARVVWLVCLLVLASALHAPAPALASSPPGPSALTPSSSSLDFFSQDMHNPSPSMTETYTNNSGTPTTVQPATILGPDASSYSISQDSCAGQTIQITNSCSVSVVFYALSSGPGTKDATLSLLDDNGVNTGTTNVSLSGTATTGTLSADQNSLDFGGVVLNQGNSNQQHVTISNGPSASVIINNVQIIGSGASSFNIQSSNCQNQGAFGPNNTCQVYIQFQPSSAGIQKAQLEINNDGTTNPLVVSLTGVGLNGPIMTVSPSQAIYGNVTLGAQSSQTFTLSDTGDAPLQIQGMFLAAGSPQVFPISNNSCSGRQISAGSSCQVTVGFIPIAAGVKDASLFLITNASNPGVTTVGLSGTGVAPTPPPIGTATVAGDAQAGKLLSCSTASYPPGTSFSYQWLRNGKPITRETGRTVSLGDADVGARLSCRVQASGPGGTQTVTSSDTAATLAELTVGKVSIRGFTINAKVTVSSGKLDATGHVTNAQILAPSAHCKAGLALVKHHGTRRCVLTSFGAWVLTIRAGGAYTVGLSPDAAAKRALNTGQTLHVQETMTLSTARELKPTLRTFNVTVHGKNTNKKR